MPYDSASGAYIRRTTTMLDETPDGDTVNTAVAGKLDTTADDSVADLNHHRVQGGHYPAPSVASASRYLKQAPSGAVSWADGVPIEQAALKDLSNVPAGTTASINITGNAATATSAASSTSAAACTGNAATATLAASASDMAAGHVLAGKTTAEAVRGAIGALSPEVGKSNNYRITTTTGQSLANGVLSNILTTGPNSGNLNVTPDSGELGWTIQESGTYRFDLQLPMREEGSSPGFAQIFLKRNRGGVLTNDGVLLVGMPTNEYVWLFPYMHSVCECQAGDIMYFAAQTSGTAASIHPSSGWATITRIR